MVKVLVISTGNFGLGNGITNVIMNYYRAMNNSKIHMDFVVRNISDEKLRQEIIDNGSVVYELNYRMKSPFKYMKSVSDIIRDGEYEIVHAHGNSCTLAIEMLAAKKGGAKIRIPHSHNTTAKYKAVHKLFRKTFDKNYTNGFACGEKAGEWLFGNKPFTVINNGIEINKFIFNNNNRKRIRKKLGLESYKVVGNIGTINYQKNHEFLIDTFNELFRLDDSYKLLIVGDGTLRSEIEHKVKSLGLTNHVIFTGKSREVPQLMQAMDLIVMPSRYEGLPLTLLEAQTAGLPCFVSGAITKEVGVTNLVKYIPLEKEPSEWAEIINKSTNEDNREKYKNKYISEINASGYSISENVKKLQKIYLDLADSEFRKKYNSTIKF